MKKKIAIITIIAIIVIAIIGIIVGNLNNNYSNVEKEITISIFNKETEKIYSAGVKTEKTYLIDVLKELKEINVVTEKSEYGDFIISIMNIEQGDNFYWSYYIDNEYATVGVSNCKVEDGKTYNFKIEKFEE